MNEIDWIHKDITVQIIPPNKSILLIINYVDCNKNESTKTKP